MWHECYLARFLHAINWLTFFSLCAIPHTKGCFKSQPVVDKAFQGIFPKNNPKQNPKVYFHLFPHYTAIKFLSKWCGVSYCTLKSQAFCLLQKCQRCYIIWSIRIKPHLLDWYFNSGYFCPATPPQRYLHKDKKEPLGWKVLFIEYIRHYD